MKYSLILFTAVLLVSASVSIAEVFVDEMDDGIVSAIYTPLGDATITEADGRILVVPNGPDTGIRITNPLLSPFCRPGPVIPSDTQINIDITPRFKNSNAGEIVMKNWTVDDKIIDIHRYDNVADSIFVTVGDRFGGETTNAMAPFLDGIKIREEKKAKCTWWPPGWKGSKGCCYIIVYYIPLGTGFFADAPLDPTAGTLDVGSVTITATDPFEINYLRTSTGTDPFTILPGEGSWSLDRTHVHTSGGESVTMSGTGYDSLGDFEILVGGTPVSGNVLNDSTLVFDAPPRPRGLASVELHSENLHLRQDDFRYYGSLEPLLLSRDSLSLGNPNVAYSDTVEASGGDPPYTFEIVSGDLPLGISLAVDGRISGTTSDSGVYPFFVAASDKNGEEDVRMFYLQVGACEGPASSVPRVTRSAFPAGYALHPTAPNPFESSTIIQYDLPNAAGVTLTILDSNGRVVRVLAEGAVRAAGRHEVRWDGTTAGGPRAAAGVYFYRLEADSFEASGQVVLLR